MAKRATKSLPAGAPPTSAQLGERADRLLYDVLMLGNTAALLRDQVHRGGWRELTQSMAVVESFLAHTRSVLDFLYPPKRVTKKNRRKKGEIYALDYCVPGWRAKAWKDIGTVRKAIDRDLVHLSLAELPATRSGEYARILTTLRGALSAFLDEAGNLRGPAKAQIRAALDRGDASAHTDDTERAPAAGSETSPRRRSTDRPSRARVVAAPAGTRARGRALQAPRGPRDGA
jgi:hypothetical protein